MVKIHFASGICSLQYKAKCLGWSGSLLLQTEAALIGNYDRGQTDYRYVLYTQPGQKKSRHLALLQIGESLLLDEYCCVLYCFVLD